MSSITALHIFSFAASPPSLPFPPIPLPSLLPPKRLSSCAKISTSSYLRHLSPPPPPSTSPNSPPPHTPRISDASDPCLARSLCHALPLTSRRPPSPRSHPVFFCSLPLARSLARSPPCPFPPSIASLLPSLLRSLARFPLAHSFTSLFPPTRLLPTFPQARCPRPPLPHLGVAGTTGSLSKCFTRVSEARHSTPAAAQNKWVARGAESTRSATSRNIALPRTNLLGGALSLSAPSPLSLLALP